VGAEAKTTLTLGRQVFAGTAHLETNELRFRGDQTLRIPLASITAVEVIDGGLHVTHAEGVAVLGLGQATSVRWAQRIQSPPTLSDKLGIKAGMTVSVLGVEDESILRDLEARGAKVVTGKVPAGAAIVLWRIEKASQLSKLSGLTERIARDGAIWVVHPRGNAAVADTVIFAAAKAAGLTYTKVVRFSDTDTAEKLVIPVAAR
jgi:Protein of unknown function (DUF3052)